ncbi:hypothetical protein MMC13_001245 [Lambiella insularis]|nr:hypothetical protein [Lambiella insularis]
MGAGFDKPADVRYFTLRFPRLQKIHGDRTFRETISFDEVQELARRSRKTLVEDGIQEEGHWIAQLKGGNPGSEAPAGKLEGATSSTGTDSSSSTDSDVRVEVVKPAVLHGYGATGQREGSTTTTLLSPDDATLRSLKRKLCTDDFAGPDSPSKRALVSSTRSRPSLLHPGPRHEPDEASREVRPPLPLLANELHRQGSPQRDVVVRSSLTSQSIDSPKVCGISLAASGFRSPYLASRSVIDLLSHRRQSLSKSLCERRLSVTFSAEYLLDCIERSFQGADDGVMPLPHVVLVDAADADTLNQEVKSLAWMITRRLDAQEMARHGRIFFLQWEVLHNLTDVGGAKEIELEKVFKACLTWDRGRKGGRVQEIWTWEAIDISDVTSQL